MQIVQASEAFSPTSEGEFCVDAASGSRALQLMLAAASGVCVALAIALPWAWVAAAVFGAGCAVLVWRERDGDDRWFMRTGERGVAIRLSADLAVILDPGELVVAHPHEELWALPDADGHMERCPFAFLDLQLGHARCSELVAALARTAKPGNRFAPVSVPQSGVIRLVFRGPHWNVQPDAPTAFHALMRETTAAPVRAPEVKPWREMTDEELARHMLALYDAGDVRGAQQILAEDRKTPQRRRASVSGATAPKASHPHDPAPRA